MNTHPIEILRHIVKVLGDGPTPEWAVDASTSGALALAAIEAELERPKGLQIKHQLWLNAWNSLANSGKFHDPDSISKLADRCVSDFFLRYGRDL